jgi:IS4 transposase
VDKTTGVRSDHILTSLESAAVYPDAFRRVTYLDVETKKRFKLLTNNFTLPAHVIAQIYKSRWAVELFFKWIKQHLRIKAFYGTSENAVRSGSPYRFMCSSPCCESGWSWKPVAIRLYRF